jgi:hypothetical protein
VSDAPTPWTIRTLTSEEITTIAKRAIKGEIFISLSLEEFQKSFLLLAVFMTEPPVNGTIIMWEEMHKAGRLSMNGYPMFTSGHMIPEENVDELISELRRIHAAMEEL